MPPSSDPNGGVSPAAILLDPKAYSKQLALGNSSSSSTSFPASQDLAARETTNSSHPVPSKGSSSTDTLEGSDEYSAYSSHEGRRRAPNSPASAPRTPHQNVSGKPSDGMTPLGTAFDPRQLLNPKSYSSKPSRSSIATPTGIGDSAAAEDTQKKRELEDNQGAGQGSLIESLYGVEARVNPPPKKQKTDSQSTTPSTFSFSSPGNTGLGDYMKEGVTAVAKDITAQTSFIDLTLGKLTSVFVVFHGVGFTSVLCFVD